MTGTEIYKRTDTYEAKAREIKIHAPHWKLLLAFDGVKSLSEVALSAEMSFADALPLTQKFLDEDWIAEQPITLDQYLKRIGARRSRRPRRAWDSSAAPARVRAAAAWAWGWATVSAPAAWASARGAAASG